MAGEAIKDFLSASTEERLRTVHAGVAERELRDYLGDEAYDQYRALASETLGALDEQRHLAPEPETNMVFIPGVMGSLLFSKGLAGVWWIDVRTRGHINDLRLSPDGEHDAEKAHDIVAFTADTSYEPFLAAVLREKDLRHEVFAYDWRKSLRHGAAALRALIHKVADGNAEGKAHVVAHSMGGLMLRTALLDADDELWEKIGRIVFVGTPHYGSPAIASYLKNHLWGFDLLGLLGSFYLDRPTFRSLWGVLGLLPAPCGVYPGTRAASHSCHTGDPDNPYDHPCANFDLYDVDAWGLDLSDPPGQREQLQNILLHAKRLHEDLHAAHENLPQTRLNKMAVIAGVGIKTLYRLERGRGFLGIREKVEKDTKGDDDDAHRQGDGRVPRASAELENVGLTQYFQGVHGELPMIPAVYRSVFRWLREGKMDLYDTPAQAINSHLGAGDDESFKPGAAHLVSPLAAEEIDLWNPVPPDEVRLREMDRRLEAGELQDFIRVRLL